MRISFTNAAGNSVVFSEGTRHMYRIRSREGLSHIPTDLQSQRAPNQNGATLINQLFEPRDMTFDLMILGSKQEQIERRRLMNRIFNPLLGEGILHVVLDTGDEYIMSCVADGTPNFIQDEVQGVFIQEAPLDLFAPDPFWRSVRVSQTPMTAYLGLWTFPFSFPIEFGQTGDFAYIDNDGDVPCPITIEFRGPALNPRIDNVTTGEFIQINREISAHSALRSTRQEVGIKRSRSWTRTAQDKALGVGSILSPRSLI